MTVATMNLAYPRLRAPIEDGQVLQSPDLASFSRHLHENAASLSALDLQIGDTSLGKLQSQAQCELIDLAWSYTSHYKNVQSRSTDLPIILSGHQPQLFHPGVWYKNFMLSRLARENGAVGINLLVDNDLGNSTRIKVPTGSQQQPEIKLIAYDRPGAAQPFEGRAVSSIELWENFGASVAETISPWIANPIIQTFWPVVLENGKRGMGPEYAIAAARHSMEQGDENQTFEIPLSRVCDTDSFVFFATHLIQNAREFQVVYNEALAEYRNWHRIRSQSHPVPELRSRDDFVEIPFWLWNRDQPLRRPAFARFVGNEVQLTNLEDIDVTFPINSLNEAIIHQRADICLRPRALVTTMYSRLVLSQMFLHGIGGAKYDQLNDVIIKRFFKIQPPVYYTFSSTHHLPLGQSDVTPIDVSKIKHQLRDLRFHPENYLESNGQVYDDARSAKQELLNSIPPRDQKSDWHIRMENCNQAMQPGVQTQRESLLEQLDDSKQQLDKNAILRSREFSFCLFPESLISELTELANQ